LLPFLILFLVQIGFDGMGAGRRDGARGRGRGEGAVAAEDGTVMGRRINHTGGAQGFFQEHPGLLITGIATGGIGESILLIFFGVASGGEGEATGKRGGLDAV
jgi:hypothetical protein